MYFSLKIWASGLNKNLSIPAKTILAIDSPGWTLEVTIIACHLLIGTYDSFFLICCPVIVIISTGSPQILLQITYLLYMMSDVLILISGFNFVPHFLI
jgi:hypothetical protein